MRILKHDYETAVFLAEKLLGWKWKSWLGCPSKNHENYPQDCRVRQFLSAGQLKSERWIKFLEQNQGQDATGDEPLSYAYSGRGVERLPQFTILVDDADAISTGENSE